MIFDKQKIPFTRLGMNVTMTRRGLMKFAAFLGGICLWLFHLEGLLAFEGFFSDQQKEAMEQIKLITRITTMECETLKKIPATNSIENIKLQFSCPEYEAVVKLNPEKFKKLFETAKQCLPVEKFDFRPWYRGTFVSEGNTYKFDLGWNSRGVLYGPVGLPGWFKFNYDFLECNTFDKNRLSGCWETVKSWDHEGDKCRTVTLSFLEDGRVISRDNKYRGPACTGEKESRSQESGTMWSFKEVRPVSLADGNPGFEFHLNGDWGPSWDVRNYKPLYGHADAQGAFTYNDGRLCFSNNISDSEYGLVIRRGVQDMTINDIDCLISANP